MDWGLVERPHEFIPLGFEAGGAFGPATRDVLREVARVAGAQASADLYHWSAMVWGEQWKAPEPCARTRAGEPRAWRSRGGAQQRRGGFGTQGVTGVLRDGLSAKRQPMRAGECTTHPVPTPHFGCIDQS
jgi:hypothetical protein